VSAETAAVEPPLLGPVALGDLVLRNRIVMAPMTRNRAGAGDAPGELAAAYYGARAGAGLIITEGTQPSKHGKGYARTPGLYTEAQLEGWRSVTAAVHERGGTTVLQMMHCGRIASRHNKDPDARTVAPSAVRAHGHIFTDAAGLVEFDTPEELSPAGIQATIGEYAQSARAAQLAGFDGVELHAASGYLPMQFLSTGTNQRHDAYGGTLHKRLRFAVEVLETLSEVWGPGSVGLRICPGNRFNDLHDADPVATYETLLRTVAPMNLAYLHVIRSPDAAIDAFALAQACFPGPRILNDGFDFASGNAAVASGAAAAISFARAFIANPDLVTRFARALPLAHFDRKTLYTPGAEGYTSYPPYADPGSA
jgi:N-ethylmaleimide reductase